MNSALRVVVYCRTAACWYRVLTKMRYFTLFSPFHLSLFFPFVASYLRFSYVLRQCLSFTKVIATIFDNIHSFSPDSFARIEVSRKRENVQPGVASPE
jgi:hypothetical protein